jgi:hypothetical protein
MKTISAIIFGILWFINGIHKANNSRLTVPEYTAKIIGRIQAQYEVINSNQTRYRRSEKSLIDDDESTEGGSAVA